MIRQQWAWLLSNLMPTRIYAEQIPRRSAPITHLRFLEFARSSSAIRMHRTCQHQNAQNVPTISTNKRHQQIPVAWSCLRVHVRDTPASKNLCSASKSPRFSVWFSLDTRLVSGAVCTTVSSWCCCANPRTTLHLRTRHASTLTTQLLFENVRCEHDLAGNYASRTYAAKNGLARKYVSRTYAAKTI